MIRGASRSGVCSDLSRISCRSPGVMPGAQARAQVDRLGLAQRQHRHVQHDAVGHHDRVVARGERRVQQPQRADRPLDLPGQRAALQAHALADAERAGAQQDGPGDQVPERLLGGQAEDHRRERAAERQRLRLRCPPLAAPRAAPARPSPGGSGTRPCRPSPGPGAGTAAGRGRGRRRARSPSRGSPARSPSPPSRAFPAVLPTMWRAGRAGRTCPSRLKRLS